MPRVIFTLGAGVLALALTNGCVQRPTQASSRSSRDRNSAAQGPPHASIASDLSGEIERADGQDWAHWALRLGGDSGSLHTRFDQSWDRWRIDYGATRVDIDTRFSNSWDKWRIHGGGVRINADTRFSKSWDKWMLETIDGHLQVSRAATQADRWLIEGAGGRITLESSITRKSSTTRIVWRVHDQMPNATPSSKLAAIFLVVQNGTLRDKVALPR